MNAGRLSLTQLQVPLCYSSAQGDKSFIVANAKIGLCLAQTVSQLQNGKAWVYINDTIRQLRQSIHNQQIITRLYFWQECVRLLVVLEYGCADPQRLLTC